MAKKRKQMKTKTQKERDITTVEFSGFAKAAKEKLFPGYGIKNVVSAGLVLVNSLPSEVREELMRLIGLDRNADSTSIDLATKSAKDWVETLKQQGLQIQKGLPSGEEAS